MLRACAAAAIVGHHIISVLRPMLALCERDSLPRLPDQRQLLTPITMVLNKPGVAKR
jgi:hypothetical protein